MGSTISNILFGDTDPLSQDPTYGDSPDDEAYVGLECCKPQFFNESIATKDEALKRARYLRVNGHFLQALETYLSALEQNRRDRELLEDHSDSNETVVATPVENNKAFVLTQIPTPTKSNTQLLKLVFKIINFPATTYDASLYDEIAEAVLCMNQKEAAALLFHKATILDPSNPSYLHHKGVVYQSIGDMDSALTSFTQALNVDRHHIPSLFNLGVAMKDLNRLEESRNYFFNILEIQPHHTEAMILVAECFEMQSRFTDAAQFLIRALQLDPTNYQIKKSLKRIGYDVELPKEANETCGPEDGTSVPLLNFSRSPQQAHLVSNF